MRIASQFRGSAAEALERVKKDGSGAASTQLIISYVKSYDPTSVVNDGERDIIVNTANLPEKVQGVVQQVMSGGAITADQAERIMQEIDNNYQQTRQTFGQALGGQRKYLQSQGIQDIETVLPSIGQIYEPFKLSASEENQQAAAAAAGVGKPASNSMLFSPQPLDAAPTRGNPMLQMPQSAPQQAAPSPAPEIPENLRPALAPQAQPSSGAAPIKVTTQAEYDALPSGTKYIHPDGSTKTKK